MDRAGPAPGCFWIAADAADHMKRLTRTVVRPMLGKERTCLREGVAVDRTRSARGALRDGRGPVRAALDAAPQLRERVDVGPIGTGGGTRKGRPRADHDLPALRPCPARMRTLARRRVR